jgi:hypothetical protein
MAPGFWMTLNIKDSLQTAGGRDELYGETEVQVFWSVRLPSGPSLAAVVWSFTCSSSALYFVPNACLLHHL